MSKSDIFQFNEFRKYCLGNAVPVLVQMMEDFRGLNELGFQLISSTDNGCATKANDLENRYNPYFELVLYKP